MDFSSINISRGSLISNVAKNLLGDLVIDSGELINSDGEGGFLESIFQIGKNLIGFVIKTIFSAFAWSLTEAWDFLIEAYYELKYFDFNQSKAEIQSKLRSNNALVAGALGRLTGTGLVWLTGVAVSTALTVKFPVVAARVALAIAEEANQEIKSAFVNLIIQSRQVVVESVLLGTLFNIRTLEEASGIKDDGDRQPWQLAEKIDEKIENISSDSLRAFINNLYDSIEDSIIEMGYIVAFTLDDHFEATKRAQQEASSLGQDRFIEITPNIEVEDETIILEAPQELAISDTQSILANHQMIYNRDVGQIAGIPEDDYFAPKPMRRSLKIIFYSKEKPPFRRPGQERVKKVETNIPDVKYGLKWSELKAKIPHFTWGKYRVTAYLDNGRQMVVYGASYNEAKTQITRLMQLSTASIQNFTQGEELNPIPSRIKRSTTMYPVYCKLIEGNVTNTGRLRDTGRTTTRIDLWMDTEPEGLENLT